MMIDVKNVMCEQNSIQIFVDFDNVSWANMSDIEALPDSTTLSIYVNSSDANRIGCERYNQMMAKFDGQSKEFVVPDGKNSVDFRIIYDFIECILKRNNDYLYIISKDKGFDVAVRTAQQQNIEKFLAIKRCESINEVVRDYNAMKITKFDNVKPFLNEIYGSYRSGFVFSKLKELLNKEE